MTYIIQTLLKCVTCLSSYQIQYNKQWIAYQKEKILGTEPMQPADLTQKNSSRWTNEEQLIAVQGKYLFYNIIF